MFTDSVVLSLYFETPLSAPSGSVVGPIDHPIQRERTTQWPTVHAATLESSMRVTFEELAGPDVAGKLFGAAAGDDADARNQLSVGDARLLLFPVRSSVAPFLWLTCPAVLSRLRRDLARTVGLEIPPAPPVKTDDIVTGKAWKHGDEALAVEDIVLKPRNGLEPPGLLELLPCESPAYDGFAREVESALGLVSDEVFSFLVRTATEVRVSGGMLADETNVMYDEAVPADAMFYVPIIGVGAKPKGPKEELSALQTFEKHLGSHLRIGEGEHVGRGWARTRLLKPAIGGEK
ncbi:MAG: type III-B CRISPR module RAMP protein Cmr4 [Polyangiaceae bacterium]|jgi:CRISPR-associated protein Cmr4|nr:type III-B CRISPR module RAMP protein Cmr4 [Polyangiaceae bacterium]